MDTCKIFLYPCDKQEYNKKSYLKIQRQYVKKILNDIMEREFKISYSHAVIEKDKYGKPFLKDFPYIHYNISHCDGFVACGISKQPIGIDIENVREYPEKVLNRAFSVKEKESVNHAVSKNLNFFQFWTLKEAYIKGTGQGLSFPLDKICFTIQNSGKIISNQSGAYFRQFLIEERQYVLSICTFQELEVHLINWKERDKDE